MINEYLFMIKAVISELICLLTSDVIEWLIEFHNACPLSGSRRTFFMAVAAGENEYHQRPQWFYYAT